MSQNKPVPSHLRDQAEIELTRRLKQNGLRVTSPRLWVFRALRTQSEPLTVSQLGDRLTQEGLNVTTIYRIMEAFVSLNVAHPVLIDHQSVGYELVEPFSRHHDHLICKQCGRMVDIFDCRLEEMLNVIGEGYGFHIDFHQMEMHGLCQDCAGGT